MLQSSLALTTPQSPFKRTPFRSFTPPVDPLVEKMRDNARLVPLSEAKQRFRSLPINEREAVYSALFRQKTLADGTPAGNADGFDFYVPNGVLKAVESDVLRKRLKPLAEETERFKAQRLEGSLFKQRSQREVPQALDPTSGKTTTFEERVARQDPLRGPFGTMEEQAEAASPKTFPLARRGGRPIATFDELRADLGDELYSQGFQKIATIGGRLDPMADPVAYLSGIVLTGSLVTPLELERAQGFIAQRDAQVERGEAPPISQDLKDRIGASANYVAAASSIFGPAAPASKLALAKSVLRHSTEASLPAFKAKVLRDALDSSDKGFKEAAVNLAKYEPPVEQAAKQEGIGLSFRKPQGVRAPKVEEPVPGYVFRPKSKVPDLETVKAAKATKPEVPAKVSLSQTLKTKAEELGSKAEQIKAEMQALEGQFGGSVGVAGGGFDPKRLQWLSKAADYGAVKIAQGTTEFASWSAKMVEELGERVKPHLQGIWDSLKSDDPDTAFEAYAKTQRESPIEPTPGLFGRPRGEKPSLQRGTVPEGAAPQGTRAKGLSESGKPTQAPVEGTRFGVSKADVDVSRKARGLSQLTDKPQESVQKWLWEARENGYDKAWVGRTAQRIAEKPRQLSDSETVAFLERRQELIDDFDRLKKIDGPTEAQIADIADIVDEFDSVDDALRASGREWGRAGVARQLSISEDFSELALKARARAKKGSALTPKESKQIEDLANELSTVKGERDELMAKFAQQEAEQIVKTAPRAEKTLIARAKIQKEIDDIFSELKKSKVGGVRQGLRRGAAPRITVEDVRTASETAVLIKRLASAYARLGANHLAEVVSKVQSAVKERLGVEIDGQAVIDAIAFRQPRTRTETEEVLKRLRSEASKRTSEAQAKRAARAEKSEQRAAQKYLERMEEAVAKRDQDALDQAAREADQELGDAWRDLDESFKSKIDESVSTQKGLEKWQKAIDRAKVKTKEMEFADARQKAFDQQAKKVEQMIAKGEEGAKKELRDAFDKAMKITLKSEQEEARRWWRVNAAIIDLQEQLSTGVFKPPASKTPLPKELGDLAFRRQQLQSKVTAQIESLKPTGKIEKVIEAANSARTLQSVGDFSVLMRQTISTLFRHPFKTTKAFLRAMKGAFSPSVAARMDEVMRTADPEKQLLREKGKLHLPEIGSSGRQAEEAVSGHIAKSIPGWKALIGVSERHMVLTLNQVRSSIYDDWVKATVKKGSELPIDELRELGSGVNALTGRGTGGARLEKAFDLLSTVFFAPRFAWSRFQTLGNTARFGGTAANQVVGKETRKAIVAQVVGTIGIMELAEANGAEINWTDPSKSDWLKIKVGKREIDPWGGYQQVLRLFARPIADVANQAQGKEESERGFTNIAAQFAEYKLGPAPKIVQGVFQGRDFLGRKIEPGFDVPFIGDVSTEGLIGKKAAGLAEPRTKAFLEFFTPLSWPEARELVEAKDKEGLMLAPLVILGQGVRTVEDKKKAERKERLERPERR